MGLPVLKRYIAHSSPQHSLFCFHSLNIKTEKGKGFTTAHVYTETMFVLRDVVKSGFIRRKFLIPLVIVVHNIKK